jgi:hypothetical protein
MNGLRTKIIELKQDGTKNDGKGRNELSEDFIHNSIPPLGPNLEALRKTCDPGCTDRVARDLVV